MGILQILTPLKDLKFFFLFIFFIFLSLFSFFIVIHVQLSPFSPHHCLSLQPSPPATLNLIPFGFVHVSFIHVPWWSFSFFPCYPPPPSPLITVSLFFVQCVWLYFACFFCWLGSTYRWDHMVFVFHYLAYFT